MKKISTLILAGMTILLASCNNFMNGSDLIQELDETLAYLQAPYADITINSTSSKTEYISPAVGNHNKTYKKGDKFTLEFVPTEGYQFTKWNVIPEGSVSIRNVYDTKTEAIIENSDFSITIEPKVYERPFATIKPENTVENPRNSTIVITFSQSMNITEDDLSKIKVLIDDFDGLDYFDPPKLSDDNTKITYIPKRDNLIPVGTVAKIVKVVIPQSFSYLADDCNVTFIDDYTYAYKINSTTETEVNLNIDCPLTEGEISYRGKRTLYLDDEITLKANPKDDYLLNDWVVIYSDDGTYVEDNIVQLEISDDKTELKLKVLTGSEREMLVTPVFAQRGYITVNFWGTHGITTPSEQKKYYVGDTFTISFREMGDYSFTTWRAVDSNGLEVDKVRNIDTGNVDADGNTVYASKPALIKFTKKNSIETKCEILSTGDSITIEACCGERPSIIGFSPESLQTVTRNTKIKVLFSQPISDSSIYWTMNELNAINVNNTTHDLLLASGKTDSNGKQYYYGYQVKDKPETKTYKNIEIYDRNSHANLLKYYGKPYFDTDDNYTLIIPVPDKDHSVPNYTTVEVKISADVLSKENVPLNQKCVKIFQTAGLGNDLEPPIISIDSFKLSGNLFLNNTNNTLREIDITESNIGSPSAGKYDFENDLSKNWNKFITSNDLTVSLKGTVVDSDSKPAYLKVSLVPVKTELSQIQKTYSEVVYLLDSDTEGESNFVENGYDFVFNMKDKFSGVYKIQIQAADNYDNIKIYEKEYGFIYMPSSTIKISVNDFEFSNTIKNTGTSTLNVLGVTIPENSYYYIQNEDPQIISINGFSNYEYSVYFDKTGSRIWIPCEESYNLSELYNDALKVSANTPVRQLSVYVRNIFGKTNSTPLNVYVIYDIKPLDLAEYEYFNVTGRGTILTITVKGQEGKKLSKICTEIKNNSSTAYCIITGLEVARKQIGENSKFGKTYYDFGDAPVDLSNDFSCGILLRGLDKTKGTITGRIKFIDSDGNESEWFNCNY